ncbi:MAG: universal stress protein [Algicola sp.]|nr:universal stress protein [Algicola sp.]
MKHILIPTDFSNNAMNAIRYALELFKYEKAHFYILHTYQDEVYNAIELLESHDFETVVSTHEKTCNVKLQQVLKTLEKAYPNPRHQYAVMSAYNSLVDEIDLLTEGKNMDLIIMGTKGITNDKSLTFGSNTVKVMRYVSCPVLSIPEGYEYTQPKKVLFPTNYMLPYTRRELKLLKEMTVPYRSVIDMLYISKSEHLSRRQEDNKEFLTLELADLQVHFKTEAHTNIINGIFSYVKKQHIDLLVMVNTRHSFLEHLLFQSTVDEMSLNLDIPFLAMQNIKRNNT